MSETKTKYLIIGNSAGGVGCIEAIRKVDATGSITIVSDEPYPVYSRPLISEHLSDKCSLERMMYRPADFYAKNNVTTVLGKKVKRLDTDGHIVELADGNTIFWQKLLLATGGIPIVPPTKGIPSKGVFTFTTLDDAKAIDQALALGSKAVVIGGGFIGVSVTEALHKRGAAVTIIEMKERILNTILDPEASAMEAAVLKKAGVNILINNTVTEVNTVYDKVSGVTLQDGSKLPCDMVILAIGVRPRTELVVGTKVKVNRGVLVDRHMETNIKDVYACGDVAEAYDFIYGENRLSPIWPNAYVGGRTAGFNMAGKASDYPGGTGMNSMSYFGHEIAVAGILNPPDNSYETISKKSGDAYRKIVLKDGYVVGLEFVKAIERAGIIFGLMKDKVNVSKFKNVLIADDFGLASLPDELWKTRLEIPTGSKGVKVTSGVVVEESHGE